MKKRIHPGLRIFITIVVYFTAMMSFLGIMVLVSPQAVARLKSDYAFLSVMNIAVGLVLSATTLLVYRFLDKGAPFQLGFGIRKRDFAFAGVMFAVSLIGAFIFTFTIGQDPSLNTEFLFGKLADNSFLLLLLLGWIGWLFGTLQEEVLNRGYFFANLHRLGPVGMILLSSVIFSLTHIPTKGVHMIPLIIHFIGGIGYGYVYLKSGSLWMSAAVHSFHNLLLDVLFNNDYSITLVTFSHELSDGNKLLQQIILIPVVMLVTYWFYGKGNVLAPASNLEKLWGEHRKIKSSRTEPGAHSPAPPVQ